MNHLILVPVDGSLFAERALAYAVSLARTTEAGILVLQVVPPAGRSDDEVDVATRVHDAETYLAQLAGRMTHLARIESRAVTGDPAETILDVARSRGADLVVMATHGRSGLGRWIYGSVADAVMRDATVPVLLVPASCDGPWPHVQTPRILVPLDGSPLAETILGPVSDLATKLGAEVHLLQVAIPHPMAYGDPSIDVMIDPSAELEAADAYLSDLVTRLQPLNCPLFVHTEFGFASSVIAAVAREIGADLIAVATHGRGGLSRLVLGSVATGVVQQASVPVLIIRPTGQAPVSKPPTDTATPTIVATVSGRGG